MTSGVKICKTCNRSYYIESGDTICPHCTVPNQPKQSKAIVIWRPAGTPKKDGVYLVTFQRGEVGGCEFVNNEWDNVWGEEIIAWAEMPKGWKNG
jgi:hypothetical protein